MQTIEKMLKYLLVEVFLLYSYSYAQENGDCECVSYLWCNETSGMVITDGTGLISERIGGCNCNCPDEKVCCLTPTTRSISALSCGVRNSKGIGFRNDLSEEDDTNFGEFPWVVDILEEGAIHKCGGSLIHSSVILTAAHCVNRRKPYIVRAGDWDNSNTDELFQHQDRLVSSIVIHENFNPAVYYNDIALLFLSKSFNLTSHIKPVCLPSKNFDFDNNKCYIIGRGKDSSGKYSAILKKVEISLVDRNTCEIRLKETNKLGRNFRLQRSFICAGGEKNKDACIGDGGGPLVCPTNQQNTIFQQIGIVSWGIGCHQEGIPGVYSSVPFLRDWIDTQLRNKNIIL